MGGTPVQPVPLSPSPIHQWIHAFAFTAVQLGLWVSPEVPSQMWGSLCLVQIPPQPHPWALPPVLSCWCIPAIDVGFKKAISVNTWRGFPSVPRLSAKLLMWLSRAFPQMLAHGSGSINNGELSS